MKTLRKAVMYDSQTQAASSKLIDSGIGIRWLGIGHRVFGIAAAADQGHDPVADLPAGDARPQFLDDPRHFQAEDFRIPGGGGYFPSRWTRSGRLIEVAATLIRT